MRRTPGIHVPTDFEVERFPDEYPHCDDAEPAESPNAPPRPMPVLHDGEPIDVRGRGE